MWKTLEQREEKIKYHRELAIFGESQSVSLTKVSPESSTESSAIIFSKYIFH